MTARADAGFSLIEALVALAVLALSAISLLAATQAHVSRIADLEARALAQFVAENRLAELELGIAIADDTAVVMLDRPFTVTTQGTPTADPDLERLDLTVKDAGGSRTYAGFVGFLARPPAP